MKTELFSVFGVLCFTEKTYTDKRGTFTETFNEDRFKNALGKSLRFYQDNFVTSQKNVLRGLHFQLDPYAQGKLVRCLKGSVFDVFVDLRLSSPTFLKADSVLLSESNNRVVWVPPGFAHGYLALEDDTAVMYKVTEPYKPDLQRTLAWNDPNLQVDWPVNPSDVIISDKDKTYDYSSSTLISELGYYS
jgi:dTDP-4-dehydrorhamnose 3,5-epimerase